MFLRLNVRVGVVWCILIPLHEASSVHVYLYYSCTEHSEDMQVAAYNNQTLRIN